MLYQGTTFVYLKPKHSIPKLRNLRFHWSETKSISSQDVFDCYKLIEHSLRFALVTGSKQEDIRKQNDQVAISFDYTGVGHKYIDAENRKDTVVMNLAKLEEAAVVEKEKLARSELIRKYPFATATVNTQLASLIEVHQQSNFPMADSLLKVYESSPVAKTGQVKYFRKHLDNNMMLVGWMAPDFTQADINGNPVRFLDFRGKYVLLDFWASWCGPCRQESPNLVKVYQDFKDRNFTILSVFLDFNKDKWLKAVKDDHLS